jgi:hypothetical protein
MRRVLTALFFLSPSGQELTQAGAELITGAGAGPVSASAAATLAAGGIRGRLRTPMRSTASMSARPL